MLFSNLIDNCNKIKTKEELLEILKGYRGILSDSIINYLNSLIELEFSVIRDYISDSDRKVLSELEVYNKIAIYNIYNRTKNLFVQKNDNFIILGNNQGYQGLYVSIKMEDKSIKLFDFDYKEIKSYDQTSREISNDFKIIFFGNISLYQTLEINEIREDELDRVMKSLEKLYDKQNPYSSHSFVVGGPATIWEFEHEKKIQEYEEIFKKLDSKKELSDEDKREIQVTKQIYDLLLDDFGLTKDSFIDENNCAFTNFDDEKTQLKKTYVKRMPYLTIKEHIKYI